MAVRKDNLEVFYSVSHLWTARDQRLLADIGVEFELCENAFEGLVEYCIRETDHLREHWSARPQDAARTAILARAFVDHAVRIPKLIKILSKDGPSAQLAQEFQDRNRALIRLRNALHHADERIDTGKAFEKIQPVGGDFSWSAWTPINTMDVYFITLGPLIVEQASPTICTMTTFKRAVDHLTYRSHDEEADLSSVFDDVSMLVKAVHDRMFATLDIEAKRIGVVWGGERDSRCPAGLSGRMRIEGLEVTEAPVEVPPEGA